ncbi:MAG TPA: biotin/lipoyl-binding protein [Nevskia sp.]|nr:biotin/lipoyl-binding protein [Nevskia sp.]
MNNRVWFGLSGAGVLIACVGALVFARQAAPQAPAFSPASDPYASGIFANGIIESDQGSGQNVNLYPEVAGTVTRVLVAEGQRVDKGAPLLSLDDTVQRALAAQQRSQADAALAGLQELRAQPRREILRVAEAQVRLAESGVKTAHDQYSKLKALSQLDPGSVSQDVLDNASNALASAAAALDVARRQYELTGAGAWSYDLRNQELQARALDRSAAAAEALLEKYTIRAPVDGVVLSVTAAVGSYVSPQGAYGSYTQSLDPVAVVGAPQEWLGVRCYVDEILLQRLPAPARLKAQMSVRGTATKVPLEFVRVQPYVSPKIELSAQRQERVDVRVLPVIFRFRRPDGLKLYPGQQVDVYIGEE